MIVVIGCSKTKVEYAAPVCRLYTGGVFTNSLKWALSVVEAKDVRVLSALHGLVPLYKVLAPYDLKMAPGVGVTVATLQRQVSELDANLLVGVLSAEYRVRLTEAARLSGVSVRYPFTDLLPNRSIGYLMQALIKYRGRIPEAQ